MSKKIFISYSSADKEFAQKIRRDLEKNGYKDWIDTENLRNEIIWTQGIAKAIDECDCLLLLWSENAKNSETVCREISAARVLLKPIIPLLVDGEQKFPSLPEGIESLQGITSLHYEDKLNDLLIRLQDKALAEVHYPIKTQNLFISQNQNPYFVGRKSDLVKLFVELYGALGQRVRKLPLAISGMAGIGKTSLVVEFAYRVSLLFEQGIYWIDAHTNEFVSEFVRLAERFKMVPFKNESKQDFAKRVKARLENMPDSLLIFDDITDLKTFSMWLPEGPQSCSILLTTRLVPLGSRIQVLSLKELDSNSALQLLLSRKKDLGEKQEEVDAAREICKLIGNLPLALELCACYLQAEAGTSAKNYLKELEKIKPLSHEALQGGLKNVVTTEDTNIFSCFSLSYERLDRQRINPYFYLMSWFAPESINPKFIEEAYNKLSDSQFALRELAANSLLSKGASDRIGLHPTVIDFAKILQDKDPQLTGKKLYERHFVRIMTNFIVQNNQSSDISLVEPEVAHIEAAIDSARENSYWPELKDLIINYAKYSGHRFEMDRQISFLLESIKLIEQHNSSLKEEIANINSDLGKAYRTKGKFKEALTYFGNALDAYEDILEEDHGEVANTLFDLGSIHLELGDYQQALRHLTRANDINKNFYGDDVHYLTRIQQAITKIDAQKGNLEHAKKQFKEILEKRIEYNKKTSQYQDDVASSYLDLGDISIKLAQYDEALQYANKALGIIKDASAKDNPDLVKVYELFGNIFLEKGPYERAIENYKKAEKICRELFGEEHPLYANLLLNLSRYYRRKGEFELARQNAEKTLAIRKKSYDPNHPAVAETLELLSIIAHNQALFQESEEFLNRCLQMRREFLGEKHSLYGNTLYGNTLRELGTLNLVRGKFDKAIESFNESREITKTNFGEKHPDYFERSIDLSKAYYQKGEYKNATEVLEAAEQIKEKVFGKNNHPLVARMLLGFSENCRRLGKFQEASDYIDESLKMKEDIYGPDHPSVADALEVKLKIFYHYYNFDEAIKTLDRTLKIRANYYGQEHPEVGKTLHDFGSYHLRKGEYDPAIEFFEKALKITESVFGKKHPDYVESLMNLANAHWEKGEIGQPLKYFQEAENLIKELFKDANHPLTARLWQGYGEIYRRKGDFNKALENAERALIMKKQLYGENHPSYADALEVQANIYEHQDEFQKLEANLSFIKNIRERAYGSEHPLYGDTLHQFGNYYSKKGEYTKAIQYFEAARKITQKVFTENYPGYIERTISLASAYGLNGENEPALNTLEEANGLAKEIFKNSKHPIYARMLLEFGHAYARKADFKTALDCIQKSKELKEAIYGPNHPSVADALELEEQVYSRQHKLSESEKLLEQIKDIRTKFYGKNHPETGKTLRNFGDFCLRKGDYNQAIEKLREALQISDTAFGRNHPEVIDRLTALASAYRLKGNIETAFENLLEARRINDKMFKNAPHPISARLLLEFSHAYRKKSQFKEANEYADLSIRMKESLYGPKHPSLAESLLAKAKLQIQFYDFDEAERALKTALNIQKAVLGDKHIETANSLVEWATLRSKQENYVEAIKILKEAYDIKKSIYGESHPEIARILIDMANAYREEGLIDLAWEVLEIALNIDNQFFGADHTFLGRIFKERGVITGLKKNFEAALDQLKLALKIYEKNANQDLIEWAETLEQLGVVYWEINSFNKSYEHLDRSYNQKIMIFSDFHPELIGTLYYQSRTLLNLKRRDEAKMKLQQALGIARTFPRVKNKFVQLIERDLKELV